MKLRLHVKDEYGSVRIERAFAIFLHQGESKYQFINILKSWNCAQFSKSSAKPLNVHANLLICPRPPEVQIVSARRHEVPGTFEDQQ